MDAEGGRARYRAFISYSHKDAVFGRRLHRRLEGYVLPRRLVGRATAFGPIPRRLAPIFRDREELSAANDLSAEVRSALAVSNSLIVVCSPAAAASPWVTREVETFRELNPGRPVLAVLAAGDPAAAFPEVLRNGGRDGKLIEPLAADFRPERDGPRLGLLKLVAGVLGIGLDELVQRDAQRRLQAVTAITAGAVAAMLAMGLLTIFALNARSEAERQRTEAEGLVEFMLTDLRDRLKGVGRLDVMSAVNQHALAYYADQDLSRLPVESLERRARTLHAMGEDDESRGDLNAALSKFLEARRTTATLLSASPDDPERIFDQAQTEFWIGSVDYARGRFTEAERAFLAYKRLAYRLVAVAPDNPIYLREAGYAEGNLCSLAFEKPFRDPATAIQRCQAALDRLEAAARHSKALNGIEDNLINRHAWLADAYSFADDLADAEHQRNIEESMLSQEMATDPNNMKSKSEWVALQRAYARLETRRGALSAANTRRKRAISALKLMIAYEPNNSDWKQQLSEIQSELGSKR